MRKRLAIGAHEIVVSYTGKSPFFQPRDVQSSTWQRRAANGRLCDALRLRYGGGLLEDASPTTRARASVVIPNWNGRELLDRCLASLRAQTRSDFEVVVVDNGSDDDSVDFVRESYPGVSIVSLDANRGFARAVNEGLRRFSGEYVALLNNDVVVEPAWLAELIACAERHPRAAAVAPKLLVHGTDDVIDSAGDILTCWFRAYSRGHGEIDRGQYDLEAEVFSASGAASLWRTAVLDDVGLFDEDYFFAYEDVDLGFRARLRGYECWYAPSAVAHHRGGATSRGAAEFTYRHATTNRWATIVKDVPASLLLRYAPRIVLAELFTIVRCARDHELRRLLDAYGTVLRRLPLWLGYRRRIQSSRTAAVSVIRSALNGTYPGLAARIERALGRGR